MKRSRTVAGPAKRPGITRVQALVDGKPSASIPALDRGLAYGDGLFETIRFVAGAAPLWPLHMARLRAGCRRLQLPQPDLALLAREAGRLARGGDCIVKLVLTRGDGRGYGPDHAATTRRILGRHDLPGMPASVYGQGARLRWCRLQLSSQPALAGLKHLNRLENVLARGEWRDPRIHEGLLLDADGHVISATAANVFIVRGGVLLTPKLDRCGVAGVARAWILRRARRAMAVCEDDLDRAAALAADEVFISNAVRGIVPVTRIGDRRFPVGPVTRRLGYTLAALGIGQPPGTLSER